MQRFFGTMLSVVAFLAALSGALASEVDRPFEELVVEATIEMKGQNSVFGHGALWARQDFVLRRIDAETYAVTETPLPGATQRQRGLVFGEDAIWIGDVGKKVIFKVDATTGEVVLEIPAEMSLREGEIAVGNGSVWTTIVGADGFERTLARFDAATGELQATVELPSAMKGMVYANGSVWLVSGERSALYRVDAASNTIVSSTELGDSPDSAAYGAGALWVLTLGDATVQRIDAETGEVVATIETGLSHGMRDIVFGGGFVWLNGPYRVAVLMIDPDTNTVLRRCPSQPIERFRRLDYGDGSLWVGGANKILRVTPPE